MLRKLQRELEELNKAAEEKKKEIEERRTLFLVKEGDKTVLEEFGLEDMDNSAEEGKEKDADLLKIEAEERQMELDRIEAEKLQKQFQHEKQNMKSASKADLEGQVTSEKVTPSIRLIQNVDPPLPITSQDENQSQQQKEEVPNKFVLAMGSANKLLTNVIELTKRNAEVERLRIKRMEVSQANKEDTAENSSCSSVEVPKSDEMNLKRKLEVHTAGTGKKARQEENSQEVNDIIKQNFELLKKKLDDTIASKPNIKREYKLTYETNFDLWMDRLRSELMTNDLLFVIDSNDELLATLKEDCLTKRKALVRDIIVSHLDEQYHKKILSEKEPKCYLG